MMRLVFTRLLAVTLILAFCLPAQPAPGGRAAPASTSAELAISGFLPAAYAQVIVNPPYAYAIGGSVLTIFDISTLEQPKAVSTRFFIQTLTDMHLSGPHLYLLTEDERLIVLNMRHPEALPYIFYETLMGFSLAGSGDVLLPLNDTLLLACGHYCYVMEIRQVDGGYVRSLTPWNGPWPHAWAVHKGFGYAVDYVSVGSLVSDIYVNSYDLTDPYHPVQVGSIKVISNAWISISILKSAAAGNTLLLRSVDTYPKVPDYDLIPIDITDPADLKLASFAGFNVYDGGYTDTFFVEPYSFSPVLQQFDGTDPYALQMVNTITNTVSPIDVNAWGDTLAVVGRNGDLVFDRLTLPASIPAVEIPTLGAPVSLAALDGYVYAAIPAQISENAFSYPTIAGWLAVVRATAGQNPALVDRIGLPSPRRLGMVETALYVYDSDCSAPPGPECWSTLHALDLSDPAHPDYMGKIDVDEGYVFWADTEQIDMALSEQSVYMLTNHGGDYTHLERIDISQPFTPTLTAAYPDFPLSASLAVTGTTAYLGTQTEGLWVLDVSNPAITPALVSTYTLSGALDILVQDNLAYVAAGGGGVHILDVTDPQAIAPIGQIDIPIWGVSQLLLDGDRLYMAVDEGGLRVVDVSNPANPVEIAYFDTPGAAVSLAMDESHLYLGDSATGLFVFNLPILADPWEIFLPTFHTASW